MYEELCIIGAGGLGLEISACLSHPFFRAKYTLRGFIDDKYPPAEVINGIPVQGGIDWLLEQKNPNAVIAIANPVIRQQIAERLSGMEINFPTIIHPGAGIHSSLWVSIDKGSYAAGGCILTTNIRIGKHTLLLPGVQLSHHTTIGDFCTLMPGVIISSGAEIGNNVTIGTGAIIAVYTKIKDGTVIPPGTIIA